MLCNKCGKKIANEKFCEICVAKWVDENIDYISDKFQGEGAWYFDEISDMLHIAPMNGDQLARIIEESIDEIDCLIPNEIEINGEWNDYGGIFYGNVTFDVMRRLIEKHYRT